MPQLFPMNWNLLFLSIINLFMILMSLIYFNPFPINKTKTIKTQIFFKNWKW
uniref:ATP synthase F0 subunit 8 n=1 Tax=Carios vespertilionis TaxID=870211 RepID=A0A8B0R9L9_9ACAR|nr:ATP synthase F0 subunit 8 [Carios vespertilionis]QTW91414.1 ATP synthase F0 subunit 8 [Carios vespertilionis]QTW91427.1 ATP synthase F0 subunit 8 [Carios vespertilionis]